MVSTRAQQAIVTALAAALLSFACGDRPDQQPAPSATTASETAGTTQSPLPSKSDLPTPESERADQYLESGEWRKALDAYYKLPPTREVLKKRAYAHTRLWELQPAIRILREARDEYPDDIEIPGYLAAALTLNRELEEALTLYRQVLEKMPGNNNARAGYALALAWSRDFPAATEEYRKVIGNDPRHLEARLGLGDVLAWQKRFEDSVSEYEAAAAATRDPRAKSDALGRSAKSLAWSGKLDASLARYQEALAVYPRNIEALLGRAEIHEWQREYPKAKASYEEVLRIAPEHPAAKAKLLQLMWVK
jgi:tetratricopeptide (TPR) repeat protein